MIPLELANSAELLRILLDNVSYSDGVENLAEHNILTGDPRRPLDVAATECAMRD